MIANAHAMDVGRGAHLGAAAVDDRRDELVVVDVGVDALDFAPARLAHRPLQRFEQGVVGFGIVERLARRIEHRNAAFGQ